MRSPLVVVALLAPLHAWSQSTTHLEPLRLPSGWPEKAVSALFERRLAELETCINFTPPAPEPGEDWPANGVVEFDTLDDGVTLELEPTQRGEPGIHVEVKGARIDRLCAASTLAAWPWPTLGEVRPARVALRFRPSPERRKAQREANQRGFRSFCQAMKGVTRGESLEPRVEGVKARLSGPVLHRALALAQATRPGRNGTELEPVDDLLPDDLALPSGDQSVMVAAAVRHLGSRAGVDEPCGAFLDWQPRNTAELLMLPGVPDVTCDARLEQLRRLTEGFQSAGTSPFSSARAQPLTEKPYVLDPGLRPDAIAREFAEQVKRQHRPRPIAYVAFEPPSVDSLAFLLTVATDWGRFELRLLVNQPGALTASKTAWPEAIATLRRQTGSQPGAVLAAALETANDRARCPGLASLWAALKFARPSDQRVLLVQSPDELKACGCPRPYSELVFARAALAIDTLSAPAGWLPLGLTEDPKAPRLEAGLDFSAPLTEHVLELVTHGPVRR